MSPFARDGIAEIAPGWTERAASVYHIGDVIHPVRIRRAMIVSPEAAVTPDDHQISRHYQLLDEADPPAPPLYDEEFEDEVEASSGGGALIRCRSCGHAVTKAGFRAEMDGRHCHVFCNPAGIVFEVGIFSAAPGVMLVGQPSSQFTWFPEHSWRIALCAACTTHLGWVWSGPLGQFYGLILDALVEDSGDE
jgi:hypothetical protein